MMGFVDKRGVSGHFVKRIVDTSLALSALLFLSPVFGIAALGIKMTSPGPIFYKARRIGKGGIAFSMLKFRTMHVNSDQGSAITAPSDCRVFGFGCSLRRLKIDELPQFWNILTGDMSFVGPRPEDPKIVARDYNDWMLETLLITPGVTGPGSLYGYIYGDALLDASDPEGSYARKLLPPKLALERAYMERAGMLGDLHYMFLTAVGIVAANFGRQIGLPGVDVALAGGWAPEGPFPQGRLP